MAGRLNAQLIRKSPHFVNTVKERVLDLRGKKIAFIENLEATEDQFDTIDLSDNDIVKLENFPVMNRLGNLSIGNNRINFVNPNLGEFLPKLHTLGLMHNRLTNLAEIDPLASLPNLKFLSLLNNTITEHPDYRLYVINKLKHLQSLDFEKVKQQEKVKPAQKFDCKDAKDQANKEAPKDYMPVQEVDAQNARKVVHEVYAQDMIKEQCPKEVATPPEITTIKAAIVNPQTFIKVTNLEKALRIGQTPAEIAIPNPDDTNMAEASEETNKMKTYSQDKMDGANLQNQDKESTPIQEAATVNSQTVDEVARLEKPDANTAEASKKTDKRKKDGQDKENGADDEKQNEESTLIKEEMLGDLYSTSNTEQGQIESYRTSKEPHIMSCPVGAKGAFLAYILYHRPGGKNKSKDL